MWIHYEALVSFLMISPLYLPTYSGMAQLVNHKAPLEDYCLASA